MKFAEPANENYSAVIARVPAIVDLKGRDRIVGIPIFGSQAIVQKTWEVGDLGVYIPAESQLSEEFAYENDLMRHGQFNKHPDAVGYLEDNRRVKALRLGGHRSDAMLLPLSSLAYTGIDTSALKEGDTFDRIGDHEILRKYARPVAAQRNAVTKATKKFSRVDAKYLPTHYDTANYWRAEGALLNPTDQIVVTQKLHGTSLRVGNTVVKHQLSWKERLAKKLGVRVQVQSYDNVYGSRKVIKDANAQPGFYGSDIWSEYGKKLDGLIPEGYIVFGELIGWLPDGRPIQKNYTYDLPVRVAELYVYRVSQVNPQGVQTDLSWDQVVEFCRDRGLKVTPELWRGRHDAFLVDDWTDKVFSKDFPQAIPLSNPKTVDEGVVVRKEGLAPILLKAKSPIFLQHETKMLDEQADDLEAEGSAA